MANDGGNNSSYYEAGTGLALMNEESPSVLACGAYTVVGPDTLTYGTVVGADGRCWLDRNLGATRVATAFNDASSYGHYYQWGRYADGHQISTSGTTTTLSTTDTPGNSNFITNSAGNYDWRNPQNNSLWQGLGGINNPCPTAFRLPSQAEWANIISSANITNYTTAYSSSLKLVAAGYRTDTGSFSSVGSFGRYWVGAPYGIQGYVVDYNSSSIAAATYGVSRVYGMSVRCIKD